LLPRVLLEGTEKEAIAFRYRDLARER